MGSRAALLSCAALLVAGPGAAQTAADTAGIREAASNYVEGWYSGDAARMERALHPDLAKRIVVNRDGKSQLNHMGTPTLVEATGRGGGKNTPAAEQQRDIVILDIFRGVASVRATMSGWIDYMHLARWNGRWVIVNVLWEMKADR